jgi:hypothetical protein
MQITGSKTLLGMRPNRLQSRPRPMHSRDLYFEAIRRVPGSAASGAAFDPPLREPHITLCFFAVGPVEGGPDRAGRVEG